MTDPFLEIEAQRRERAILRRERAALRVMRLDEVFGDLEAAGAAREAALRELVDAAAVLDEWQVK
jgi:hypothetical protein